MPLSEHQFKPGQSGNPSGRPKQNVHVSELARQYTQDAIRCLASIINDEKAPPSARTTAANSLLDRGYGKPIQQLEHGGIEGGNPIPAVLRVEFIKPDGKEENNNE